MRRTKLLVTVGPATRARTRLERLARAGVDGFRLNFSHGREEEQRSTLQDLHRVRRSTRREFAIVADLQGPKIRIGELLRPSYRLREGERWTLRSGGPPGDDRVAPVSIPRIAEAARPGDPLLVGDGAIELVVESVSNSEVTTRIFRGGIVAPHQGLYLPRAHLRASILGPKDVRDLSIAVEEGIDYVAVSFVRSASDVRTARRRIARTSSGARIGLIAKIERAEALQSIDRILQESDGIMVARGDLGIEVPLERLALEQKALIARANDAGRFVIVATQLLLSMVRAPRPTRAEATDVANAVLDGADALMLSEESAVGRFPFAAVDWLDRIARTTEGALPPRRADSAGQASRLLSVDGAVARAAVDVAQRIGAAGIMTPTHSGATARAVAQWRPCTPIVALSPDRVTRRQLALVWGVQAGAIPGHLGLDALRGHAARVALERLGESTGARIVLTAGYPVEGRPTNLVHVVELTGARDAPEPDLHGSRSLRRGWGRPTRGGESDRGSSRR
ncbi:MAG: pyruvate kinase [Thermoplasmata archaeon]|nr:pyruvate kinase [Thermoplasmata archaeon]